MSDTLFDLLAELEEKVQALEGLPHPQVREQIFEVLQLIDRVHRPGLGAVASGLRAAGLFDRALDDPAIRILFALYDLAPIDERTRAEIALEAVRPYIRSHGGELEVLEVADGEVRVRLAGTCSGCPASASTLEHGVRAALEEGFEGFRRLVVEPAAPDDQPLQVAGAQGDAGERPVQLRGPQFRDLLALDELAEREPTLAEIETGAGGERHVLLVRAGAEAYAFDPRCPACGAPLAEAQVSGWALVCAFTNCAYDLRSGRRIDGGDGEPLRVLPVAVRGGRVLLAGGFEPAARLAAG